MIDDLTMRARRLHRRLFPQAAFNRLLREHGPLRPRCGCGRYKYRRPEQHFGVTVRLWRCRYCDRREEEA